MGDFCITMDKTRQSYIYAALAIFFWSTVPTAFKISLGELDILPMLTIAVLTSAFVLLIVVVAGKKIDLLRKTTCKELISSALLGFINPFLYYQTESGIKIPEVLVPYTGFDMID